jgi:hypothetical protein
LIPLIEERQARLQERATLQAQLKAMQERSVQERTRIERQLARQSNGREGAMRVVRLVCPRMKSTEDNAAQLARDKAPLLRAHQALREEIERFKTTRMEKA